MAQAAETEACYQHVATEADIPQREMAHAEDLDERAPRRTVTYVTGAREECDEGMGHLSQRDHM
jgi:hypothetical protein